MGNGVDVKVYDNYKDAAKALLGRDHPNILRLLNGYREGEIGPYFVPEIFISDIPEVVKPNEYEAKFSNKRKGNHFN